MQNTVSALPAEPAVNQRDRVVASEHQSDFHPPRPVGHRPEPTFIRKMQAAMLPHHLPSSEDLALGMCFFPGKSMGGDLFDAIRVTDDLLAFLMLDVAVVGERAVCITAMAKNSFTRHIRQGVSPFSIVERVHKELLADVGDDLHLRAFFGFLDLHSNELIYCNAGCVGPLVYRASGKSVDYLSTHGTGITVANDDIAGESRTWLGPGDCLVLYSDGIFGLFDGPAGEAREKAGTFIREVVSAGSLPKFAAGISEKYNDRLRSGPPIDDDISVLFAGMFTTSAKNHLKESLGFNADDVVYLQFINYLEEMDRTTAVILSAMDLAGYPDELIRKMKIVLTELLVNAIVHGNRKESMKRVVVGHLIDRNRTVISIMDEGDGFDPKVIPDPTLPENIDKPCGRGLFIVRHYVETIKFNRTGNRVTIIKNNTL